MVRRRKTPQRSRQKVRVGARVRKRVTIAGLRTCPVCKDTKQFLKQNKVPFKYHEVDSRPGAKLADSVHAKAVPVIQVCDTSGKQTCKVTEGFRKDWLKRQLGL